MRVRLYRKDEERFVLSLVDGWMDGYERFLKKYSVGNLEGTWDSEVFGRARPHRLMHHMIPPFDWLRQTFLQSFKYKGTLK